ncbi:MAG: hypothetical protein ACXVEE_33750 [Polyangiales bacterium]
MSKLLGELEKSRRMGHHFTLESSGGKLVVRARWSGEADYFSQSLVLALREAAPLGARGKIVVADGTEPPAEPPLRGIAHSLELDGETSRYRKIQAKNEPGAFERVMELLTLGLRVPREPAGERREPPPTANAAATLLRRVKTPLKTRAALDAAAKLLDQIVAEPNERALPTLRSIWSTLEARAPRAKTRAAMLDSEAMFRPRVAKALFAVALPSVTDAKVRAKLAAATRKEWPTKADLVSAMTALERHLAERGRFTRQ